MTIAYHGVPGAFGHAACLLFVPGHDCIAKPTPVAVLAAVASGAATYGVLPTENSIAGPVHDVVDLLRGLSLPTAMHDMPIRMHLLGRPGTALESVTTVVSHPIGLAQCARTLREMGVATEEAGNTAIAAKALAAGGSGDIAVLASEAAAAAYGLTILRRDMQDRPDNVTRFCVLGPRGGGPGG